MKSPTIHAPVFLTYKRDRNPKQIKADGKRLGLKWKDIDDLIYQMFNDPEIDVSVSLERKI